MPSSPLLPDCQEASEGLPILCLPYAGGGAAPFHRMRPFLPGELEVTPFRLPGRESRVHDPPFTEWAPFVNDLANAVTPHTRRPYAVVGHSFGAITALELIRELRRRSEPLPRLLVAAASKPPDQLKSSHPIHALPDAEFLDELDRRYGGIPDAVRRNEDLLKFVLPALRADMRLMESYCYTPEPPLELEILALGGQDDAAVTVAALEGWRGQTSAHFSTRRLPGDHFFLVDDRTSAARTAWQVIAGRLTQIGAQ